MVEVVKHLPTNGLYINQLLFVCCFFVSNSCFFIVCLLLLFLVFLICLNIARFGMIFLVGDNLWS